VLDDELTFEITSRQKSKATQRRDLIIYLADAMRFLCCYVFVTASPAQNFAPPESLAGKQRRDALHHLRLAPDHEPAAGFSAIAASNGARARASMRQIASVS